MGLIQSSLNNLVLSSIGAVSGVAYGLKGAFKTKKPQADSKEYTTQQKPKMDGYKAAKKATVYGNDAIYQKAIATFTPAADLKEARMKMAMSLSVADYLSKEKKGDKE